ncbi:hypothetical protein [Gluconobacter sphaericus]|uniref:hypothetical protein n=1 Tax=Gluconobacter sphaericus TaxID=574987 RepID=UPI001F3BD362|nr:hypothetical protein [Gluconobacter sphaericus]
MGDRATGKNDVVGGAPARHDGPATRQGPDGGRAFLAMNGHDDSGSPAVEMGVNAGADLNGNERGDEHRLILFLWIFVMSSPASARDGRVTSGACAGTGGGEAGEEPPFDPDGARWQRPSPPFLFFFLSLLQATTTISR